MPENLDFGEDARRPDEGSRAFESPFAVLGDLDFHAEFHRRYPRGAILEDAEDVKRLVAQSVHNGGRIRDLERALAAERARSITARVATDGAARLAGEVAIRRFLDDLAEAGLPSTLYQTFTPDYRAYIGRKLVFYAATANNLLGQFNALPERAVADRDARYADRDNAEPEDDEATNRLFEALADDGTGAWDPEVGEDGADV